MVMTKALEAQVLAQTRMVQATVEVLRAGAKCAAVGGMICLRLQCLVWYWAWFIVPTIGFPRLTWWGAFGLTLLMPVVRAEKKALTWQSIRESLCRNLLVLALAFGLSFLV